MNNSVIAELEMRGFVEQLSDDSIEDHLADNRTTIYVGFDPTADSLHLGHLVPIMAMAQFQRFGHKVLALVGGATGMVGDPSGRSDERNLLTEEQVAINSAAVKKQLGLFMDFEGDNAAFMLDNNDWISQMSFTAWLREVGKHISVGYMLGKESVRSRMDSEQGISYTEFSYMTMQAYDFAHLAKEYGCTVQGGGNDQWGNITAGIDLTRRVHGKTVFGVTFPLLTTQSGAKFGKSAGNAVWLDPNRTSPFQFYQYWYQTADGDVEKFLKLFTFLEVEEIQTICKEHALNPEKRIAQQRLASEVTAIVHGKGEVKKVQKVSEILFTGQYAKLDEAELNDAFSDAPSTTLSRAKVVEGIGILALLTKTSLMKSNNEARRAISQGGIYVNGQRIESDDLIVKESDFIHARLLILRSGKRNFHVIEVD